MEILAGLTPVRFSCDSLGPGKRLPASISADGRSWRFCQKIGLSLDLQPSKFVSAAGPRWNLHAGCWRGIRLRGAAAYNGKKSSKGSGKSKGGPEKKHESKKDNVWSSGFPTDKANPVQETKQDKKQKQNVWNFDSSSGKSGSSSSQQRNASSKTSKESRDGGGGPQFVPSKGRTNVDFEKKGSEGRLQPLVESSNVATTNAEKKKELQLEDIEDTTFLRFLSPLLPIEEEILLQPEEPVSNPLWTTFCSSTSGVWRGVGATFSPVTGEFEPISLDENKQLVYDARVLSTVETLRTSEDGVVLPPEQQSLHRRVLWSLESLFRGRGEGPVMVQNGGEAARVGSFLAQGDDNDEAELGYWEDDEDDEDDSEWENVLAEPGEIDERWEHGGIVEESEIMDEIEEDAGAVREDGTAWRSMWDRGEVLDGDWEGGGLPSGETEIDFIAEQKTSTDIPQPLTPSTSVGPSYGADLTPGTIWTDVMEEDNMVWEPGLVFFEDGAYSRGPLELTTDTSTSDHENVNTYTCKIEQCLVAGGHKRLRLVHTVSVDEGEKVEVLRVAVYEEEWMGPCNMKSISDAGGHHLELFSERARHSPEDLMGTWKVFNMEAMAIHPGEKEKGSFVFSCKETSVRRGFPKMPKLTLQDDGSIDMSDFSMSWLTGNVSAYVTFSGINVLTFGVGWVCEDGTRLVMERVYAEDGKLLHVNSKSEIKSGSVG